MTNPLRILSKIMVALTLLTLPILSGCTQYEPEDNCKNKSTFVGDSGARHIVSIDLPFTPGPVAVLSTTQDGVAISRSSKLWLGESGTMLYALDDTRVWAADIGTFELKSIGSVGAQAGHLVGADRESTLLVTDHERSSVWILDETRSTRPVEVPVGPGPGALAGSATCRARPWGGVPGASAVPRPGRLCQRAADLSGRVLRPPRWAGRRCARHRERPTGRRP